MLSYYMQYLSSKYNCIVNHETSSNNICKQQVGPLKPYPHNISSLKDGLCIYVIWHMYLIDYKVQHFGELTLECATTYYKYGCALFDKIKFKTNLLATNLHQGRMKKVHHSLKLQKEKVFSIIHHVLKKKHMQKKWWLQINMMSSIKVVINKKYYMEVFFVWHRNLEICGFSWDILTSFMFVFLSIEEDPIDDKKKMEMGKDNKGMGWGRGKRKGLRGCSENAWACMNDHLVL